MAGRIAGITIEIGGDTSNLQKSLKGVDSELKKTQSNLKDVNRLLKLDPGNTQLLIQKQKNLEKAIGSTKTRLQELKNAQAGVAQGSEEWDALQREIIETEQNLKRLEGELQDFGSVGAQQAATFGEAMQSAGEKIEGVGQKLAPISAAAAGLVTSLAALGYSAITNADDLNTLAKQTGFSTAEIQRMQYAADLVDVSFSDIEGALTKMKGKMDPANETFAKLGVSVTNADGSMRDASDVFYDTIEALSQVENETERDQLAMDLFGKSADSLAGIIDDGGAALKQYGQEAEDLGLILDQDTLDSLNTLNDTIDKLKANFTGAFAKLGATIATQFGPYLEKAAVYAQQLADKISNLSPETVSLIAKIAGVVAVLSPLTIGIGKVVGGVGKVMTTVPKVVGTVKKIGSAVKGVGMLLSPHALLIAAIVAAVVAAGILIYKNWDKIKAATEKMISAVKKGWQDLKNAVVNAATAVKNGVTNAWNSLTSAVSNAVSAAKNAAVNGWNSAKTGVVNAVNNIRNSVVSVWNGIKSSVTSVVSGIVSTISSKFQSARATVSSVFLGIRSSITNAINGAKSAVSTAIDAIKGFLKFKWKLPHLPLPHIQLSGGQWPWGLFGEGVKPSVSIQWYKRAYDDPMMFTQPTVMQTPQGLKGFGDGHGAEIVLGLNKLRELVATSAGDNIVINVYPPQGASVDQIARAVEQKLTAAQQRRMRVYA